MVLRTRNSCLTAKIESSEGVENAPDPSTDAILIDGLPRLNPQATIISTNEVTGSLDGFGDIVGGMRVELAFDVLLKGSGVAGTAPEYNDLLKACGWAPTITATAVPASAEACANGGSATTAVLGSTAASLAQAYQGMPVTFTGAVAGSSFISDYTAGKVATLTDTFGASITNTTNYQIPVNVRYKPASTSIPSLTLYLYMDGLLYKFVGCRGTFTLSLDSGGVGRLSFTFSGMYLSKTDASVAAAVYDNLRPPVWKNGKFTINKLPAALQNFSLDLGAALAYPDNPNSLEGFDPAIITSRKTEGSINPYETLVATRALMDDFRAGTKRTLYAQLGGTTGNRVGIVVPQALFKGHTPTDRDGMAAVDMPFEAVGQDSGAYLTFY